MAVIRTDGLTKLYGETIGVEDLTFSVEAGEVFGFLGPNGAGKTTTLRTLLGLLSPTEGTATVLGSDVRDESALIAAKRRIGYLPATLAFDDDVTGRTILDYHASIKGDVRSEELLSLFDPPLERKVGQYSTGNRQMLGIVQAFMHDPELVIMDEPTSGLDPLKQERFYEFVRTEREQGTTIFFSSHVLSEVRRICDRVAILRNGTLVALEDVETLLDRGGKRVRVVVDGENGETYEDAFEIPGVIDLERIGDGIGFTFTGDYNVLLSHLTRFDVRELDVTEPSLEDVFMHFYGEDEESENEARTEREGQDENEAMDENEARTEREVMGENEAYTETEVPDEGGNDPDDGQRSRDGSNGGAQYGDGTTDTAGSNGGA